MVACGVPAYLLLGLLMSSRDEAAAWVLGAGGVALSFAGLALVAAQRAGTRSGLRESPLNSRRMFAMSSAIKTQQAIDPKP
jgi:hypothetical protein